MPPLVGARSTLLFPRRWWLDPRPIIDMLRRHERYTAYRTFVVSPGSSANDRKRQPSTNGSWDVPILPLSRQDYELARSLPASLHAERPSRHGSNPQVLATLHFLQVPPLVSAALCLAGASSEFVRDPIARMLS